MCGLVQQIKVKTITRIYPKKGVKQEGQIIKFLAQVEVHIRVGREVKFECYTDKMKEFLAEKNCILQRAFNNRYWIKQLSAVSYYKCS